MKHQTLAFILLCCTILPLHAQHESSGIGNVSLGSHRNADSTLTAGFNIGINGRIDTLRGFQLNLINSGIRGSMTGANIGILSAVSHGDATGFQMAPIFNAVGGTLRGMQFGALSNVAAETRGVQFSGFSNITMRPFHGLQLSAITNIARKGAAGGAQIAGAVNVASGAMRGLQLASYNYADTLQGAQIGLLNVARHIPKGWMIGIVNYSNDATPHKIGLLNISPDTRIDFQFFAGTSSKTNAAVRLRGKTLQTVFGVGTHYMGFDKKFSGAIFYRRGVYFNVAPHWTLSGDLGYFHIETFEKNSSGNPRRLFSLQARIGADWQFSKRLSAFATVGYGTTRYYHHARNYRTRPLFEAGLSVNYQRHTHEKPTFVQSMLHDSIYNLTPPTTKKRPWIAAAEVTGINVLVHCFDRFVMNEDFADVTLHSIGNNFKHAFVWDNDQFSTNLFAHPYHGNLYFNSARSNGLSFLESAPYALGGSLMWEFFGEVEPPAINDLLATTFGGICIGEVTNRISDLILRDNTRGWNRFLREAAATLICPMKGFNRITRGEAWRVTETDETHRNHPGVELSLSAGARYLADNGALFRGEFNPYLNLYLEYGDALDEGHRERSPYDFFSLEATVGLSKNQPLINRLHILGRLFSWRVQDRNDFKAEFGLYQFFNYYDSKPVRDGSDLTPYRISEAASIGPGFVLSLPKTGALNHLEQRFFVSGIMLGGTKSDYYNVIDRDYNMGSGFSLKSRTHMELRGFGRFILNASYFRIFTWKGYEGKDLTTIDPIYLNAQGDRGNAALLVMNPHWEIDLPKGLSISTAASFFIRKTHYKYYPDVRAKTFELSLGLTWHL